MYCICRPGFLDAGTQSSTLSEHFMGQDSEGAFPFLKRFLEYFIKLFEENAANGLQDCCYLFQKVLYQATIAITYVYLFL